MIRSLPVDTGNRCGAEDVKLYLLVGPESGTVLSLFLDELTEINGYVQAARAHAVIETGRQAISGEERGLPPGPIPVDLASSSGHSVDLHLAQSHSTSRNIFTLEADRAARLRINGQDQYPTGRGNIPLPYFS